MTTKMDEYQRLYDDIESALWPTLNRHLKVHLSRAMLESSGKHRAASRRTITSVHKAMANWVSGEAPQPIMEWETDDD